jgi:hypothetical protein
MNQGDVAASTLARVDLKFSCKLQMKYSAQEMLSTMKMQPEKKIAASSPPLNNSGDTRTST